MRRVVKIIGNWALAGFLCLQLISSFGAAAAKDISDLFDSTYLLGINQGSKLSAKASALRAGGYELADGTQVSFAKWYSSNWIDMRADFLTQIYKGLGFLWGFSTGEQAPKYRIDPGFRTGIIMQVEPTIQSILSLSVTTTLGGRLRERPCVADYGDIGGVQAVNCRFAASTLEPAQTLRYLVNMRPPCRFSRRTDPGFSLSSDPPFYVPWVSFESRHSISPSGF